MRNIVVAYDRERAIGANGDLLWKMGEMRADMQRFREITMGSVLIMGRKTLDSIGIALPGRTTIMLTRGDECKIPGIITARSLDEAFSKADDYEDGEVFVVGGGEIYKQALDEVERVYATEVDAVIPGADTHFPELDPKEWNEAFSDETPADNHNVFASRFVVYERTRKIR